MHKWENKNKKAKVTDNMMGGKPCIIIIIIVLN